MILSVVSFLLPALSTATTFSSLEVSTLGLGTMTFGEQNSEADAHAQLDYAIANGINLIDAA
ncbi:aldo/keto reductase, partial [Salmonella enterica subsp. enterica serovar Montevideo]|nr:aldo/keto reductase [Salmonella enterica subsp. enterica serovar Montevideo]